jgi:hypothetical protein
MNILPLTVISHAAAASFNEGRLVSCSRATFRRARLSTLAALAVAAACLTHPAAAIDLIVDEANGNSPYSVTAGTQTFDLTVVGQTTNGVLTQSGGTFNSSQLFVGRNAGSTGHFALSGGQLSLTSTSALSAIGTSGTGVFDHSGGTFSVAFAALRRRECRQFRDLQHDRSKSVECE